MIRIYKTIWWSAITIISAIPLAISGAALYLSHHLPSIDSIKQVELQIPLRIYSADNKLIAEFSTMRRSPIAYNEIPPLFIDALLSAEDDSFLQHHGIDLKSLIRAGVELIKTGKKQTGGSTITMQVAKNYFLTSEQTYTRKAKQILLALKLEQELSKTEILELYINKIFLGHRSYGIEAAAQVYYGKSIKELSLAQMATIASLPKSPSGKNPITNPEGSLDRRNWVLNRMYNLGKISKEQYEIAKIAPETAKQHDNQPELSAPYVAEMVRASLFEKYGESLYTNGYTVITTVSSEKQEAATKAVHKGLLSYDERHGYRGPEQSKIPASQWKENLEKQKIIGPLEPAIVTGISSNGITILNQHNNVEQIDWSSMKWARPYLSANSMGTSPKQPADIVHIGDLIRIKRDKDNIPQFSQIPLAESALVSLDSKTGAIEALVGGFSFEQSNYNRAIQAKRQPGSSFKPFIYSAALDAGFTAASLINDAPIVVNDGTNRKWRPKNDSNNFLGPIPLREGLYRSRNLVTIRLLQSIGIDYTLDYIAKFGIPKESLPPSLSLSLGSADLTPLQVTRAWTVFANGGYKIYPYLITEIKDRNNTIIFTATPPVIPNGITAENSKASTLIPIIDDDKNQPIPAVAESVIDSRTAYIMTSILQDVIRRGTGARALALKRSDLSGKTGTTNETKDTWFAGYNADLTTVVWVGLDQPKTLGRREYGGTLALPIWIDFMRVALDKKPNHTLARPAGIVQLKIDADTGRLASENSEHTYTELFKKEDALPKSGEGKQGDSTLTSEEIAPIDLF